MLCYKCNSQIPDYSLICTNCGAEMSAKARQQNPMGANNMGGIPNVIPQPMLWYTILVKFYLILMAISAIINATTCIFASSDLFAKAGLEDAFISFEQISASYKFADIIYAVLLVISAIMAFVVRKKLVGFKKSAPIYLITYFAVTDILNLAYVLTLQLVSTGINSTEIFAYVIDLAVSAAVVYANYVYFKKRKHLFKN